MISEDKKIVILDVEGTGNGKVINQKITQFAALVLTAGVMKSYDFYNYEVDEINDRVVELTKISIPLLKEKGIPEETLAQEIKEIIDGAIVLAYGYEFDKSIINNLLNKYNLTYETTWLCAQTLIKSRVTLDTYKLGAVAEALNCQTKQFHNALSDATATLEILEKTEIVCKDSSGRFYLNLEGGDQR